MQAAQVTRHIHVGLSTEGHFRQGGKAFVQDFVDAARVVALAVTLVMAFGEDGVGDRACRAVRRGSAEVDTEFAGFIGGGRDDSALVVRAADHDGFALPRARGRRALRRRRRRHPCRCGRWSSCFPRACAHGRSQRRMRGMPARSGMSWRFSQPEARAETASDWPKPSSMARIPPGLRTRLASGMTRL